MYHRDSTGSETWSHHYRRSAMFDGRRFCILQFRYSTLQQMTCQWRHWWFPTTSCFGVTNHSEAASLWLVTRDRATINSGSPPSCGATFWQWSVASPSEMGWLASKVSRYLSILCLWYVLIVCLEPAQAYRNRSGRHGGCRTNNLTRFLWFIHIICTFVNVKWTKTQVEKCHRFSGN